MEVGRVEVIGDIFTSSKERKRGIEGALLYGKLEARKRVRRGCVERIWRWCRKLLGIEGMNRAAWARTIKRFSDLARQFLLDLAFLRWLGWAEVALWPQKVRRIRG